MITDAPIGCDSVKSIDLTLSYHNAILLMELERIASLLEVMLLRIHSFAPLLGERPSILILGSIPGVLSLEREQYYGNERNHFWRLICAVLKEPLHRDYAERAAMLKRRYVKTFEDKLEAWLQLRRFLNL